MVKKTMTSYIYIYIYICMYIYIHVSNAFKSITDFPVLKQMSQKTASVGWQDPLPLNSAVIVRVWPRPYSVWEDNPEDPEAIDGYFLLDVNESQPQDLTAWEINGNDPQHSWVVNLKFSTLRSPFCSRLCRFESRSNIRTFSEIYHSFSFQHVSVSVG